LARMVGGSKYRTPMCREETEANQHKASSIARLESANTHSRGDMKSQSDPPHQQLDSSRNHGDLNVRLGILFLLFID
jgi:hypothetical protein